MVEHLFEALTLAMGRNFQVALVASFAWGVLSILLSPCHLSSVPLIIGYVSSQDEISLKNSFNLSFVFAIGILITIALVGLITASFGRLIGDVGFIGNMLIGGLFVVVGLYLLDIISFSWSGVGIQPISKGGWLGALLLGLIFGIGLGPCTFAYMAPVLGVVFQTATENLGKALLLIAAFGIGHCAVIVLAGSLTNLVQRYLNWTEESRAKVYMKRLAGLLVLLGGVYFIYSSGVF